MTTVLTGLRTNSHYHFGNYVGALQPMIELQKTLNQQDQLYLFLPDLHSLESDNATSIYHNTIHNTKLFMAAGFNAFQSNSYIYRQSRVCAHSQLAWILNYFVYMGEASRMTQYKDKSQKRGESIPVSLFTYPILQAADILLYHAHYIPVGDDQKQHIELTRDIAERFNNHYGAVFTVPKTWKEQLQFIERSESVRIRSLTDPSKKMSKSDESKSCILLTDEPANAAKKIMSATTDTVGMIDWNWEKQPGVTNLLQILALLTHSNKDQILAQWQGKTQYGELKKVVADEMVHFLTRLQSNMVKISDHEVETILTNNEAKVSVVANRTLTHVESAIGLR